MNNCNNHACCCNNGSSTNRSASFLSLANGQAHTVNDNKTLLNDSSDGASTTNKPLPVLLIHGYASDASIWSKWEDLLKKDGIIFYPITFFTSWTL